MDATKTDQSSEGRTQSDDNVPEKRRQVRGESKSVGQREEPGSHDRDRHFEGAKIHGSANVGERCTRREGGSFVERQTHHWRQKGKWEAENKKEQTEDSGGSSLRASSESWSGIDGRHADKRPWRDKKKDENWRDENKSAREKWHNGDRIRQDRWGDMRKSHQGHDDGRKTERVTDSEERNQEPPADNEHQNRHLDRRGNKEAWQNREQSKWRGREEEGGEWKSKAETEHSWRKGRTLGVQRGSDTTRSFHYVEKTEVRNTRQFRIQPEEETCTTEIPANGRSGTFDKDRNERGVAAELPSASISLPAPRDNHRQQDKNRVVREEHGGSATNCSSQDYPRRGPLYFQRKEAERGEEVHLQHSHIIRTETFVGRGSASYSRNAGRKVFPLQHILEIEDTIQLTLRVTSSLAEFEDFLGSERLTPAVTISILTLFSKVSDCDLHRESVSRILQVICSSPMIDTSLGHVIQQLQGSEIEQERVVEIVEMIRCLFSTVCKTRPSFAPKILLNLKVLTVEPRILEVFRATKPSLEEELKELLAVCENCMQMLSSGARKKQWSRFRRGPHDDDEIPPEDFVSLPIFPADRDMRWSEKPFLRANKEEGSFRDVNHYLDVQFRLMREDYIRPLRKGIREYKQMTERGERGKKISDLRLYHGVKIVGIECKTSLEHLLQFDVGRLKNVMWKSSKRLSFGFLLCLSLDDFETWYFATVTNRDPTDLQNGIIQVKFEDNLEEIMDCSPGDIFIMAETTGAFFEAYRHVLEGLQEFGRIPDSLPFARYIVDCNKQVEPPAYLLGPSVPNMNLGSIFKPEETKSLETTAEATKVSVLNPTNWPSVEQTALNEPQVEPPAYLLGPSVPNMDLGSILNLEEGKPLETTAEATTVSVLNPTDWPSVEQTTLNEPQVEPPAYLLGPSVPNMNLGSIFKPEETKPLETTAEATTVSVLNPTDWPSVEQTMLNEPQLEAVQTALTKEIAIIQGPPGTGKTFVGLKVAKVLLENTDVWTGSKRLEPILVVCYTNHALDQFLEGILEFCPEGIVRVGSRCKSSRLEEFNLKAIRRNTRKTRTVALSVRNSIRDCEGHVSLIRFRVQKCSSSLQACMKCIVKETVLEKYMSQEHYSLLRSLSSIDDDGRERSVMADWLSFGVLMGEQGEDIEERRIDPSTVDKLPHELRAQLYRLWHQRAQQYLQHEVGSFLKQSAIQRRHAPDAMAVLFAMQTEIPPDNVLCQVMDRGLYAAIRSKMKPKYRAEASFCIRKWLGLSGSPEDFEEEFEEVQDILYPWMPGDEDDDDSYEDKDDGDVYEEDYDETQWERQLDDDDTFGDARSSQFNMMNAIYDIGVGYYGGPPPTAPTSKTGGYHNDTTSQGQWSVPQLQRDRQQLRLLRLIRTAKPMDAPEVALVGNIWHPDFKTEDRVRLYLYWVRAYQEDLQTELKDEAQNYAREARRLQELKFAEDMDILRKAKVIGMTTTGAARYRRVLAGVACPIIIIEEAAEVLESHVVTTLHEKCQHLILIGDHQQLRPSPTVYELCRHYNLDLSLFERLVNNSLPHASLAVQHRMRPEISLYVRHIYPNLVDHDSTKGRDRMRGLMRNVFFLHHEKEETKHGETGSKSNTHEAEMSVRLCRYLLKQGYPADTITILTAYTGQVLVLKNIISQDKETFKDVHLTAVDNYQGEENDIIILSLVRSNQEGSVGFLGTDNRVCVALSRARNGFFAFGNFKLLMRKSELWKKVVKTAKEQKQYGEALVLRCENHPNTQVQATSGKDFDKVPEGGCQLACGARLERCGHVCRLICHGYDRDHKEYRCLKKCTQKLCESNHICPKKCYEMCGPCKVQVQKTVPICDHKATMDCHIDPGTWKCTERCESQLPCGHRCSEKCGECYSKGHHLEECPYKVEKVWPCGHRMKAACHVKPGKCPCPQPCKVTLDCGHECTGTCGQCLDGRLHLACKVKCGKLREGLCRHKCNLLCGSSECMPCERDCEEGCPHEKCQKPCGDPCQPCTKPCLWRCNHRRCQASCVDPCSPCKKQCGRKLPCNPKHRCRSLCGEACVCFICEQGKFVPLTAQGDKAREDSCQGEKVMEAAKDNKKGEQSSGNVSIKGDGKRNRKKTGKARATKDDSEKTPKGSSMLMNKRIRLMKVPHCRHIFQVDALDAYVENKLKNLPLGAALPCPVCPGSFIHAYSTWRYSGPLLKRHREQQQLKMKLSERTRVPLDHMKKIGESAKLLTGGAFGKLDTVTYRYDVNQAFALTNQIKFAFVMEKVSSLDYIQSEFGEELQTLKTILLKPIELMAKQQHRQMTLELRRFVLSNLLHLAVIDLRENSKTHKQRLRRSIERNMAGKKKKTMNNGVEVDEDDDDDDGDDDDDDDDDGDDDDDDDDDDDVDDDDDEDISAVEGGKDMAEAAGDTTCHTAQQVVAKTTSADESSEGTTRILLEVAERLGERWRLVEESQQVLRTCHQDKLPENDLEIIFNDCTELGFEFKDAKKSADVLSAVLESPSDKDLCDIVPAKEESIKAARASQSTKTQQRSEPPLRRVDDLHRHPARSARSSVYSTLQARYKAKSAFEDFKRPTYQGNSWQQHLAVSRHREMSTAPGSSYREGLSSFRSIRMSSAFDSTKGKADESWRRSTDSSKKKASTDQKPSESASSWRERPRHPEETRQAGSSDQKSLSSTSSWRNHPPVRRETLSMPIKTKSAVSMSSWRHHDSPSDELNDWRSGTRVRSLRDRESATSEASPRPSSNTKNVDRSGRDDSYTSSFGKCAAPEGSWRGVSRSKDTPK